MTQASLLHAFLSVLADHALLGRLFFASVEMGVLAGIVWLIIRIRRRASPRLCSILWLLVMAKALVALAIGAPLAIIQIRPPEPEPVPVAYEPRFDYEDTVTSFEPEAVLPLVAVEPGPMEAAPPAGWSFSWKRSAAETVSGTWIIGAILVGLYAMLNRVRLHRLVSRAMPPPTGIAERYSAAVKHLRVKRPPRLRVTHDLESPALVGTLTPAILLPAWMSEKPNHAQLDWSLRHELTHWKLGDPLADFVRQIARILFFFHPVTWWAARKWEESAELACDRVVVRTESEAENYAGELYQILAQIHGRRTRLAMGGLFATRTQIGRRIAALLSNPLKWPARLGIAATLCLVGLAAITCAMGGAFVEGTDTGDTPAQEATPQQLKAMIKEAYWDKYQHLESYALSYSGESVRLDEETGAVISRVTEDVKVLTRGDDKAVTESRMVPSTDERAELVRVATGGVYRRLMVRPDSDSFDGWIRTDHAGMKFGTLGTTPFGYSRLDSMRWPEDQVLHPNGANSDMTVLMNLPNSRVLPEAVRVDGRECYVLERGPQGSPGAKFYLAKDLGFAVCKLEAYHREETSRFLKFSITFNDFAEVAPGLHMPREGELIGYRDDGSVDRRIRWHNMSLDLAPDIPDDAFVLEFPDGTEVMDENTMKSYISYQGQLVSREEFFASRSMVGKEAPELAVAEWVSGEPASLASLRGKTVVLAFWDSRDEACAELVPLLNGLLAEYSEQGLEILSIHSAEADTNALKKFISEQSISFRVAVDKAVKLYKGATFEEYNVWKVPAVFIIDAEGKVRYQDIPLAAVEQAVQEMLREPKQSSSPGDVPPPTRVSTRKTIADVKGPFTFRIRTVTPEGEPQPGVNIRCLHPREERGEALVDVVVASDENGVAEFRVTESDLVTDRYVWFRLADDMFVPPSGVGISPIDNEYEYTFELMSTEEFRLRVVNEEGDPIPDAELFLTGVDTWARGRSDERGIALVRFPDMLATVVARADGYAAKETWAGHLPKDEPYTMTLGRGFTISGKLTDPDGKPLAQVRVTGEHEDFRWSTLSGVTDADGAFELKNASEATYNVLVHVEDMNRPLFVWPGTIRVGQNAPNPRIDLQAKPGAVLKGKYVTKHKLRISDRRITVSTSEPARAYLDVPTKDDGTFAVHIPVKTHGEVRFGGVSGFHPEIVFPDKPRFFDIERGEATVTFRDVPAGVYDGVQVHFVLSGQAHGVVRDASGKPVAGVQVIASPPGWIRTPGRNGAYTAQLPIRQPITLEVRDETSGRSLFKSEPFTVGEGEVVEMNITLPRRGR